MRHVSNQLLTKQELRFLLRLRQALPEFEVLPQVSNGLIVHPASHIYREMRNNPHLFQTKAVDFTVIDRKLNRVICVVELRWDVKALPTIAEIREEVMTAANAGPWEDVPLTAIEAGYAPKKQHLQINWRRLLRLSTVAKHLLIGVGLATIGAGGYLYTQALDEARFTQWVQAQKSRIVSAEHCPPYIRWIGELANATDTTLEDKRSHLQELFTDALLHGCMEAAGSGDAPAKPTDLGPEVPTINSEPSKAAPPATPKSRQQKKPSKPKAQQDAPAPSKKAPSE